MAIVAALDPRYVIADPAEVLTPAIVVYPHLIRANIETAIRLSGPARQLRPHVKTHKTRELTRIELEYGIEKHKCATIAEAELLAESGARDIVLAYTLVGPNIARFARLQERYPHVSFMPLVDHQRPVEALAGVMFAENQTAQVLLDLEVGLGRTGVEIGDSAMRLYRKICHMPGLRAGGLHVYDGHNHQQNPAQRMAAVQAIWDRLRPFVAQLEAANLPVPRLVCGNTPTSPCWSRLCRVEPRIECSPGTLFLNDWNYYRWFEDVPCPPAACLITRVVSKPRSGRLTLDLGYKAVASDSPMDGRLQLLGLADARIVLQNEEHLVIESSDAEKHQPGDLLYAWPAHICPTCALHRELLVVEDNRVVGAWLVEARDRVLHC